MESWYSSPVSGRWNEQVALNDASPSISARTLRTAKDRPSRTRSTMRRVRLPGGAAWRKYPWNECTLAGSSTVAQAALRAWATATPPKTRDSPPQCGLSAEKWSPPEGVADNVRTNSSRLRRLAGSGSAPPPPRPVTLTA